jgi:hypothetical protein
VDVVTQYKTDEPVDLLPVINIEVNVTEENCIAGSGWCMDSNHAYRFVGEHQTGIDQATTIRHYSHSGFDKCLANKTVIFIGDSRVRYQYMNLIHYLGTKQFMKCRDYPNQTDEHACFLIDHKAHLKMTEKDWNLWYNDSTTMVAYPQNGKEHQMSLCDCFRPNPFQYDTTYENRFTRRVTQFGESNLIYLQSFRDEVKLNGDFPPYSSFGETVDRCAPGDCRDGKRNNIFKGSVNATMWEIVPLLNATHMFVNIGWEEFYRMTEQSSFSCELKSFAEQHPDIQVFLISHPPQSNTLHNPSAKFNESNLACDIRVLDRTSLNKNVPLSWYWDINHVLSILNEEYNHRLIEKICPLNEGKL